MKTIFFICLIASTLTSVQAEDESYECTMQQNGTCIVDMSKVLPDYKYDIDDVLALCDYLDGMYNYEADTCTID